MQALARLMLDSMLSEIHVGSGGETRESQAGALTRRSYTCRVLVLEELMLVMVEEVVPEREREMTTGHLLARGRYAGRRCPARRPRERDLFACNQSATGSGSLSISGKTPQLLPSSVEPTHGRSLPFRASATGSPGRR